MDPARLQPIEAALAIAVAEGRLPGAVVAVGRDDQWACCAVGLKTLQPEPERLDVDTVYDCASLTKVVVLAPLAARLLDEGVLEVDAPVARWLPGMAQGETITLRHLLTHTSGLQASLSLEATWSGAVGALERAMASQPTHPPGSLFRYSDINFVLLAAIVQRAAGQPLEDLAERWLFAPLGMRDSGFRPLQRMPRERIAPTEQADGRWLRGEVHDPTARRMGGVSGHAGLFSTAADLARYARMVCCGGELEGTRVLSQRAVQRMLAVATPASLPQKRSLGWDIDSPLSRARGALYPPASTGHTGFTGCALWLDAASRRYHVLLSNRVHPQATESIVALYEQVATLAFEASRPD